MLDILKIILMETSISDTLKNPNHIIKIILWTNQANLILLIKT